MEFIAIGVDPVVVHLGPLALRWYGLMIALGIVAGLFVATREGRRLGLSEDDILSCALWAVLAAIVGARLFHVVDRLDYYLTNPAAILALYEGGLAIYGGLVGGVLATLAYIKLRRLPLARVADAAAPAAIMGQAIGRIGCIINGDVTGNAANLPWAFVYNHPNSLVPAQLRGLPTHPYPAYELLWDLIIFGTLWWLRGRVRPEGMLFLVYVNLYSLGRFVLTFVRQEQIVFLGLQQAQVLALLGLVVAVPWMVYLSRRASRGTRALKRTSKGGPR